MNTKLIVTEESLTGLVARCKANATTIEGAIKNMVDEGDIRVIRRASDLDLYEDVNPDEVTIS